MIPESLLQYLNRITPIQARAIARDLTSRGRPLTVGEISKRSGLRIGRVSWISRQTTWEKIPVGEAEAFMRGCGITLRNQRHHLQYIRRTAQSSWPMAHLVKLSARDRKIIMKGLT
jgi:hypothetical protein